MKLNSIHLENFKCFECLDLEFNDNFNVIIGDNASGKTSILDALSFSLGTFFIGVRKATNDSKVLLRPLKSKEKRVVLSETALNYKLPFIMKMNNSIDGDLYESIRHTDKVAGGSTSYIGSSSLINKAYDLCLGMNDEEDKTSLPIISYYGTERVSNEKSERKKSKINKKTSPRAEGYYNSLDPRSLEERFITWFALEEDKILKFNKSREHYDAFTDAIKTMVPEWKDVKFSWDHESIIGLTTNGEWLSFDMMSSGYKSIIRLSADIAYRCIKLNPHHGKDAVKKTNGVVLIDELDMHLHPLWQRTVVDLLKATFPSIQFITTSHSPFIIQSLKSNEIIKIKDNKREDITDDTQMKGLEDIVEDEMDVVNPGRSEKYDEYYSLAAEYFNLVESIDKDSSKKVSDLSKRLDEIEVYFTDNPVMKALLVAERKMGG